MRRWDWILRSESQHISSHRWPHFFTTFRGLSCLTDVFFSCRTAMCVWRSPRCAAAFRCSSARNLMWIQPIAAATTSATKSGQEDKWEHTASNAETFQNFKRHFFLEILSERFERSRKPEVEIEKLSTVWTVYIATPGFHSMLEETCHTDFPMIFESLDLLTMYFLCADLTKNT